MSSDRFAVSAFTTMATLTVARPTVAAVAAAAAARVACRQSSSAAAGVTRDPSGSWNNEGLPPHDQEVDERREARGSPAALFGMKRIGLVAVNEALTDRIESQVAAADTRALREAYQSLTASLYPAPGKKGSSSSRYKQRIESTPALALARATTQLPGQYAVLYNIFRELESRLGKGWLDGEVVEVGGVGSGAWALADAEGLLDDIPQTSAVTGWHFIQSSRFGMEMAQELSEGAKIPFDISYDRRINGFSLASPPSLVISPFHLSTLPTPTARQQHLASLVSLKPTTLILIDRATPEGWSAISTARSQILSTPNEQWHVVAPCPHDSSCPLATSSSKDTCRFSQRLQAPETMRKTKHSKRGDEDLKYSYLVFQRGTRPAGQRTSAGRKGGVAREVERIERMKRTGRVELSEVNDGEYAYVQQEPVLRAEDLVPHEETAEDEKVMTAALRNEAYHWPRLVFPPLKRTGHVVMDTCHPSGEIVRMTVPKSLSKQAYHDARKTAWGDLFPHEPKGAQIVRTAKGLEPASAMEKSDWPVAEVDDQDIEPEEAGDVYVKTFG